MYINAINFYDGKGIRKAGDPHPNPRPEYVAKGLVKEVKVQQPTETKKAAKRAKRKSENTAKLDN